VDQSNLKFNHAKDLLEVPSRPITRARAKKLKEALNGLVYKHMEQDGPIGGWNA